MKKFEKSCEQNLSLEVWDAQKGLSEVLVQIWSQPTINRAFLCLNMQIRVWHHKCRMWWLISWFWLTAYGKVDCKMKIEISSLCLMWEGRKGTSIKSQGKEKHLWGKLLFTVVFWITPLSVLGQQECKSQQLEARKKRLEKSLTDCTDKKAYQTDLGSW